MSNKLNKNCKKRESGWSAAKDFFGYLLDGMVCAYMLLVIVVLPFYNQQGYTYIGTEKAYFFQKISVCSAYIILPIAMLYLICFGVECFKKCPTEKKAVFWKKALRLSVTDIFALLYGVSLMLSYACSAYKEDALWGATGWFMGLLPQLILLGIYFAISRFWVHKKWMVLLFLPVSLGIFALGYLNRFGIYPIDMKLQNPEFISTIGNINWYCGYLVSVFFGGYYLLWQSGSSWNRDKKIWKQALLMIYVAVGFASMVTQGSMSGLVTLAGMLIVTFCLSAKDNRKMLVFWQETLLLSLACLVTLFARTILHGKLNYEDAIVDLLTCSIFPVIATLLSTFFVVGLMRCERKGNYPIKFFGILTRVAAVGSVAGLCLLIGMITVNTLRPGSLGALSEVSFFTLTPDWGSNRGATWKAGVMCFVEQNFLHKLVGVGPDCMEHFLYQSGSLELNALVSERFGMLLLKNAHNEWLTILVNGGIFGCASFVGMVVSATKRYFQYGIKENQVIIGACGFCLLAYTINNMFSFQQSVNTATIFVVMGIGEAYARRHALF